MYPSSYLSQGRSSQLYHTQTYMDGVEGQYEAPQSIVAPVIFFSRAISPPARSGGIFGVAGKGPRLWPLTGQLAEAKCPLAQNAQRPQPAHCLVIPRTKFPVRRRG